MSTTIDTPAIKLLKLLMLRKNKSSGTQYWNVLQGNDRIQEEHMTIFIDTCALGDVYRNLIDISSTNADPLQSQDVQERQDKYQDILAQLPIKTSDNTSVHNENGAATTHDGKPLSASSEDPLTIFEHIHPTSSPIPQEELYDMMNKINDALQEIRIEPVGDMVVHLKMLNDPEAIQF